MNFIVLKKNLLLSFLENIKSENLGFYFSFFLHLLILLFAIGIPNFFNPKSINIPLIIPMEIINISEVTSIPKESKETKSAEVKKTQVKEKKFNSSDNQEIKKIKIKDKPKIKNIEIKKEITPKEDIVIKEKKELPLKLEDKKINLDTKNVETIPSKKIIPKLKPKPNKEVVKKNTDLNIEVKKKPEPEFNIASMLKDLRNEKSIPKKEDPKPEKNEEPNEKLNDNVIEEDAQLTISEIDLVLQQLSQCFIGQTGVKIEPSMYVKITATIRQNRRVIENSVRIVDTNIVKSSPVYRPITESAMRTLLNPDCIPLKLPENKYDLWKNLTMTFDYSVMRGN